MHHVQSSHCGGNSRHRYQRSDPLFLMPPFVSHGGTCRPSSHRTFLGHTSTLFNAWVELEVIRWFFIQGLVKVPATLECFLCPLLEGRCPIFPGMSSSWPTPKRVSEPGRRLCSLVCKTHRTITVPDASLKTSTTRHNFCVKCCHRLPLIGIDRRTQPF